MEIEEHWDKDDPRVLHVHLLDPLQWESIEVIQRTLRPEDFPPHWAALVDFGAAGRVPQISLQHVARLVHGTPPGACGFAIVRPNVFMRALLPLLARLYPSIEAKFMMTDSEDEARTWLIERLAPPEVVLPSRNSGLSMGCLVSDKRRYGLICGEEQR